MRRLTMHTRYAREMAIVEEASSLMRVPAFEIRAQRSIRLAKCDAVPRLMIIAGPNGAGKSTLLNGIRASGWKNIIYLGPHRAMRRQIVQQRHLISTPFVFEDLLTRPDAPGFEGIESLGARDPWGNDDSVNYLKHTLCQIEIDFQAAISERYHRDGEIKKGSVPDPWRPLRELCANLLPHLRFAKIDSKNRDRIHCLWTVHGATEPVDLDELSSGEKSIIQMFFPLVERGIRRLLADISGTEAQSERPEQCLLVDEPELHLHPNLQVKVLDYFRVLTAGTQTQVMLATHSPTMVESASFEELFLLRPVELVGSEENQLIQVANDDERLQVLKDLFGNTSNLTSMQTMVVVEGVREQDARRTAGDRKLYRALHPGFDHVSIIPGGGRSECLALVRGLREAVRSFSSQLRTVALVDRDYKPPAGTIETDVFPLPVTMIENFLIDPDAIWAAIQSVAEKTTLNSKVAVESAITVILDALEADEIARRAAEKLGTAIFRPSHRFVSLPKEAAAFCLETQSRFSESAANAAVKAATSEVETIKALPRRREHYHGKDVLQRFYGAHLHATPLSKVVFHFETARHARARKSVKTFFDSFFGTINPKWELSANP